MKLYQLLVMSVLCVLTVGCMGTRYVVTNTTAFYVPEYQSRGRLALVAADESLNNSLEFAHYKARFEKALAENGYSIVQDANYAQYIALVAYGIDEGKTSVVTTPIFGQTGGGTTYTSGRVNNAGGSVGYSSTSYTMPTYGVVGSSTSSRTRYTRAIALDIVQAKSLKAGKPKKVYEGRAKSTGSCSVIVEVFDEMLEAMFEDFPGKNGKVNRVDVPSDANC